MQKFLLLLSLICVKAYGQELYVFSEPASNMPAKSLSIKQSFKSFRSPDGMLGRGRSMNRHTTELMLGIDKNMMLHGAVTLSNMFSPQTRFESMRLYGKYRILSNDELYRHFRMAVFMEGAYSRNDRWFDEVSVDGDHSGFQAGVIATQLLHKLAVSSTLSWTGTGNRLDPNGSKQRPGSALGYSLSAGYLILPETYTDYSQMNLNLYLELLGQQTLDTRKNYMDLAPAVQMIFNSQAKLNLGYRFQLGSNMERMTDKSWLVSFEWLFLNVLK